MTPTLIWAAPVFLPTSGRTRAMSTKLMRGGPSWDLVNRRRRTRRDSARGVCSHAAARVHQGDQDRQNARCRISTRVLAIEDEVIERAVKPRAVRDNPRS